MDLPTVPFRSFSSTIFFAIQPDADVCRGNVGLDGDAFGQGARHGQVVVDARVAWRCLTPDPTVAVVESWDARERHDGSHGIEMVLGMDDVRSEF